MSVLVVSKILRTFVNTLTPDDKYCLDNRETLLQPIQSQFYKKLNDFFFMFLLHLWNLHVILNYSKKTLILMVNVFPIL